MPQSDDSIIQVNQGTGTTVSLPSATTSGNTIIIFASTLGWGTLGNPIVSGFTRDAPFAGVNSEAAIVSKQTSGGETSWTISLATGSRVDWVVHEREGLDGEFRVDVTDNSITNSLAHGNLGESSAYDGVAYALHSSYISTGGVAPAIDSQTGGFAEFAEQNQNDGTIANVMAVSQKYLQQPTVNSSTATATGVTPTRSVSLICVYAASGARRAADVDFCTGFEYGAVSSPTNAPLAVNALFTDFSGSPTIVSTSPRNGTYCLEISGTSNIQYVGWDSNVLGATTSTKFQVERFCFMFVTSLPGADLQLFSMTGVTGFYRSASQKIEIKKGTGTAVLSDATVSANVWIGIDLRLDPRTTTHTVDWSVDYNANDATAAVAQTQASGTGTALQAFTLRLGRETAGTGTVRYDDVVHSRIPGHYPLGDMAVFRLNPDPAGTLTISGTTANFNTFTANGTMAAWNAATALAAIDDMPPTIGASADGIAQITAAGSDYVIIPMETYNLAANGYTARGVRLIVCGWAASGTAAGLGIHGYNGTDYTLFIQADAAFDNTAAQWVCAMVRTTGRPSWVQANLDALEARVGYSSDATPDVGIHAVIAELVCRKSQTEDLFGSSGDLYVTAKRDPDTLGLIGFTVEIPTGRSATVDYTVDGVPNSTGLLTDADSPHYEPISGGDVSFSTVSNITVS